MSSVPLTIEADVQSAPDRSERSSAVSPCSRRPRPVYRGATGPGVPPARDETDRSRRTSRCPQPGSRLVVHIGDAAPAGPVWLAGRSANRTRCTSLTLNLGVAPMGRRRTCPWSNTSQSLHNHAAGAADSTMSSSSGGGGGGRTRAVAHRSVDLFGATVRTHPLTLTRPRQHDSLKLAACYRDMLLDAGLSRRSSGDGRQNEGGECPWH